MFIYYIFERTKNCYAKQLSRANLIIRLWWTSTLMLVPCSTLMDHVSTQMCVQRSSISQIALRLFDHANNVEREIASDLRTFLTSSSLSLHARWKSIDSNTFWAIASEFPDVVGHGINLRKSFRNFYEKHFFKQRLREFCISQLAIVLY